MKRVLTGCLVALIICCLAACGTADEGAPAAASRAGQEMADVRGAIDVRGPITHMRQASAEMASDGILGVILVEGGMHEDTRFEAADVHITAETQIKVDGWSGAARFSDLAIGQLVEIQFGAAPQDADPPLGRAQTIRIMAGAP